MDSFADGSQSKRNRRKKKRVEKQTWDDILVLAIECGLNLEQFWRLNWREFLLYRKGFEKRELNEWERTRILGYSIYWNITKYEKSRKGIKQWMPLPSDEPEEELPGMDQKDFIESQKRLHEALKQKKVGADAKNNTNRR